MGDISKPGGDQSNRRMQVVLDPPGAEGRLYCAPVQVKGQVSSNYWGHVVYRRMCDFI